MEKIYESRILLVDDNRELCDMVQRLMKKAGFINIRAVYSIHEASRELEKGQVQLWILDVNLPDGSGFAFMETLRKKSRCPVLFLSARDEDEDRLQGLGLGADDYVTKPFLMKELILRVTAILRRSYYLSRRKGSRGWTAAGSVPGGFCSWNGETGRTRNFPDGKGIAAAEKAGGQPGQDRYLRWIV